jgi:hypothetical protein
MGKYYGWRTVTQASFYECSLVEGLRKAAAESRKRFSSIVLENTIQPYSNTFVTT